MNMRSFFYAILRAWRMGGKTGGIMRIRTIDDYYLERQRRWNYAYKDYIGMYRVQAAQLQYDKGEEDAS